MWRVFWVLAYLGLVAWTEGGIAGESRTWTDVSGKYATQAECVKIEGDLVVLMKDGGEVVRVPLEQLSRLSRAVVKWEVIPPEQRPALGVKARPVEDVLGEFKRMGLPEPPVKVGVWLVRCYIDGPADLAGLKQYDIIYRAGVTPFRDEADYVEWLASLEAGKEYTIEVAQLQITKRRSQWIRGSLKIRPVSAFDTDALLARCPIKLKAVVITDNSIGIPVVSILMQNVAPVSVIAFEADIHCFTRFDEPVTGRFSDRNVVPGISQTTIDSGKVHRSRFTLNLHETTAKVKVALRRVKLEDGTEWTPEHSKEVSCLGGTVD